MQAVCTTDGNVSISIPYAELEEWNKEGDCIRELEKHVGVVKVSIQMSHVHIHECTNTSTTTE